jgi:CMP-N-acetylneuraminic acid synthetase
MTCVLAIIPARGGSRGIPYKNIVNLAGKPLIVHTIEVAKKSKCIDRIIVSTDAEKIADICKKFDVEIQMRPAELARDDTPDLPVFQYVLKTLKEKEGKTPDIVINLRPTCPLRTEDDIDKAVKKLIETDCDSVRTVSKVKHHPFWIGKIEEELWIPYIKNIDRNKYYQRQLLPDAYFINGGVDVMKANNIIENDTLYGKNICAVSIPFERSIDIDTTLDLKFAEVILKQRAED